jgi:GTP-binding protein
MFVDETRIQVRGGTGGDGCAAFLREKYRPWGGPAGGDGGRGGAVVFEASLHMNTLLHLYRRRKLAAGNGQPGQNKNCSGKAGKDAVVRVPCGTVVRDEATGEVLCDLTQAGQRFVVAPGGRGGRGNQHFATPTHQTPHEHEAGAPGVERRLHLELKLIADVGLIGLPNAGKSTLLSRISAARPRIAPYPFTTRHPCLGIVDLGEFRQLVVADLPGLIAGAHRGAGLGGEFLRHVERTSLLVHLLDADPPDGSDPVRNFETIERELRLYSETLHQRPRLVVANKLDLPRGREHLERLRRELDREVLGISAVTGEGLREFLTRLLEWATAHQASAVEKKW